MANKATFKILMSNGTYKEVIGYRLAVAYEGKTTHYGIHRISNHAWNLTHIESGRRVETLRTMRDCYNYAIENDAKLQTVFEKLRETKNDKKSKI